MNARDNVNLLNEMGSKGFDRMSALGELNLRTWEKLASRQMDAMSLMMEQGVRQMKLATEAKGYGELVKGQAELVKDTSARLMEETKANMQVVGDVRDEYRSWLQQGMSELSSEVRKNAPAA